MSEWKEKFTKRVYKNPNKISENLNVTNENLNIVETCENLENFICYNCDYKFKTLNLLMNHRMKKHKIKTKCRNNDQCEYREKCWFSHEEDDSDSVKTYYTT